MTGYDLRTSTMTYNITNVMYHLLLMTWHDKTWQDYKVVMTSLTSSSLPLLNLLNVITESISMTWLVMIDVMIDDDN